MASAAPTPTSRDGEVRTPFSFKSGNNTPRVIVVLERACLETVKTKKVCACANTATASLLEQYKQKRSHTHHLQGFELLNSDDHQGLHKKLKRNPAESRPDIVHQVSHNTAALRCHTNTHSVALVHRPC